MSDKTGIEWTRSDDGTAGATWNPVTGCTKVSAGCDHCYAETFAERWRGVPGHHFENGFDVTLRPERLEQPLRWKRPRRVFVNSMSDLFHDAVPDEHIVRVFDTMLNARRHTFQVLTKRHARMRSFVTRYLSGAFATEPLDSSPLAATLDRPPANIWLGVSAEDQKWWDIRVPALMDTPAAVRFVSAEPLLGPIDPALDHECGDPPHWQCPQMPDWLIIGGESGPGARPMRMEWVRELLARCREPEVSTVPFVKQLGSVLGKQLGAGSKGGDMDRWPPDLRIREFPRVPEMTVPA